MTIIQILTILGIPTIISGTIALLINRYFLKKDKNDTRKEELENSVEQIKEDMEKITTVTNSTEVILPALTTAIQALLRDRIIQMYNYYHKDRGYMPIYARESLEHLYSEYHNLGGNGVIEDLIEKLYDLPTEPEK